MQVSQGESGDVSSDSLNLLCDEYGDAYPFDAEEAGGQVELTGVNGVEGIDEQSASLEDNESGDTSPADESGEPVELTGVNGVEGIDEQSASLEDNESEDTSPDSPDSPDDPESIPAEGDAGFAKNKETTLYGTSGMSNPKVPTSPEDRWQGSYVYYGKVPSENGWGNPGYGYSPAFLGKPIKYRVLDRHTALFNPSLNSVLLDSDVIITTARYYNGPNGGWSKSFAKELLNGERFLENDEVFTDIEKSSIINSYKNAPDADDGDPDKYAKYANNYEFAKLTGEKIFFLDIREAFRPSYGYSEEHDIEYVGSRIKADPKAPSFDTWYTRTKHDINPKDEVMCFNENGETCYVDGAFDGVKAAPAFNVNLSSILFSTAIRGTKGQLGTEYKLTLLDNDMSIALPSRQVAKKTGKTVTVPYTITGTGASEANAVSVLILDSPYIDAHTDNPGVLFYDRLETSAFSQNGTGTFTLPDTLSFDGWGSDYYVYLIAEDINGKYETDYASRPYVINKGGVVEDNSVTVTFDLQGHGNGNPGYYQPRKIEKGSVITEPVEPSERMYVFKGWYTSATNHSSAYKFDFSKPVTANVVLYAYWKEKHTVTFDLTEHASSRDEYSVQTQYVEDGEKAEDPGPFSVEGYEVAAWYTDRARWNSSLYDFENTPVTQDMILYASWAEASNCRVTFDINAKSGIGPGTVYVDKGSKVTRPEDPVHSEGWVFGGWYTDKACSAGKEYDFNSPVNGNMILYAKWTDKLNLWVNGVQLGKDSLNTADWTYDTKTNELNLKDITFTKTDREDNYTVMTGYVAYVYAKGIALNVTGKGATASTARSSCNIAGILVQDAPVTIDAELDFRGTGAGIYAKYVNIRGGRINISSNVSVESGIMGGRTYTKTPYGIYGHDSVHTDGGDISINMSESNGIGIRCWYGDIDLCGGSLKVRVNGEESSRAIDAMQGGINNSLCFIKPADGKVDASGHFFTDAFGDEAFEIELEGEDSLLKTVAFDLNGKDGMPPSPQLVKIGSKAKTPQTPAAVGYSFDGWYKEPECNNKYNFSTAVTENITLYAGWTDKAEFYVCFTDLDADAYGGLYRNEADPSNVRYETVYTGASIKPAVLVTGADGTPLRSGIDYTIKYSNNKKASKGSKSAKVTVKGKGNFKGSKTLKFYVLPADIDRLKSDGKLIIPLQYVKKGTKPEPVLYYGSYKITSKDLKYDTAKVKADKVLDLKGKGNFTGTITGVEFKVLDKASLKANTIKVKLSAKKHVYNGSAQTLSVASETIPGELKVTDGNGNILDHSYYDVTYKNNENAGKATAIIKGKASYRGSAKVTFAITPDSTSVIDVAPAYSGTNYYNPAGVKPSLSVKVTRGGTPIELKEGRDYKVAYKNNKAVGTGKYTVSFTGNYKRKKTISGTFKIDKAAFAVSVRTADMTYKKKGKYYAKVFVADGNTLLKAGKDYKVGYYTDEACTVPLPAKYAVEGDSATLYVKVTGKGNYAAEDKTDSYNLYKLTPSRTVDLSKARIVDAKTGKKIKSQTYTGRQVKPYIKVQIKKGKKWVDVAPATYEVTFFNNVNKGKATILVNPRGNKAAGSKTVTFKIGTRSFGLFSWL